MEPFSRRSALVRSYLSFFLIFVFIFAASLVFSNLYLCGDIILSLVLIIVFIVVINHKSLDLGLVCKCKCVFDSLRISTARSIAFIFRMSDIFSFRISSSLSESSACLSDVMVCLCFGFVEVVFAAFLAVPWISNLRSSGIFSVFGELGDVVFAVVDFVVLPCPGFIWVVEVVIRWW